MEKCFILVSKSPRRSFLLKKAGLNFDVRKSTAKEKDLKFFDKEELAEISKLKAYSVKESAPDNSILISADTMVVLDGVCLKKPKDIDEAFFMLKKLSNRVHSVYSAITVLQKNGKEMTEISETKVYFRKITDEEIKEYIESFNPLDKAGSYGIQDFIGENEIDNPPEKSFIKKIEGDYENVMGISTKLLKQMLENF